ncbi:MAG: hypothetical protein NTY90_02910 [Candidatus Micrarchaeota archaeon]|nr:hypothetical protein [Candidatus Micrarchaeota archaeon]
MRGVNALKFAGGLAAAILLRLPQAVPNVEPVMAFVLPYSKAYGALAGFAFAFISVLSFDFISGRVGVWTLYTAVPYGLIGLFAAKYLGSREKRSSYAAYAAGATIAYDAVTAFMFGLQFNQPLWLTFVGQVPFTLVHLAGNISLSAVVSPLIYRRVLAGKQENPSGDVFGNASKVVH